MSDPPSSRDRFAPHAAREMADMFDDVSDRYDFLNSILSLGRDASWREAMALEVPESARVVLDLCTGSGTSLDDLRDIGRLVLGADISVGMLRLARERHGSLGWAPRLVAADAFVLPLPPSSVDAVTVAFGIRNLRPRERALAEIARVLRPGGTLIVLEGAAPSNRPFAPFHRFYLRHVVPFVGRFSHDPSAYCYLGESILDFGSGAEFEREMGTRFEIVGRRRFMLGATRLWTARRRGAAEGGPVLMVQTARVGDSARGNMPTRAARRQAEWRRWNLLQLVVSAGIMVGLASACFSYLKSADALHLESWHRRTMSLLLAGGTIGFGVRTLLLGMRIFSPPPKP